MVYVAFNSHGVHILDSKGKIAILPLPDNENKSGAIAWFFANSPDFSVMKLHDLVALASKRISTKKSDPQDDTEAWQHMSDIG